ncbi:hypothetical protein J6590_025088 [Homalodisca vitripennis]|nr:hypothetical protein J6590_025088 [Homalodisca vitripennis]
MFYLKTPSFEGCGTDFMCLKKDYFFVDKVKDKHKPTFHPTLTLTSFDHSARGRNVSKEHGNKQKQGHVHMSAPSFLYVYLCGSIASQKQSLLSPHPVLPYSSVLCNWVCYVATQTHQLCNTNEFNGASFYIYDTWYGVLLPCVCRVEYRPCPFASGNNFKIGPSLNTLRRQKLPSSPD